MSPARDYLPEAPRFSRRWWMGGLRTLFWVAIVTILIWVYADLEKTEEEDFRATVRLTTGNSQKLLLMSPVDVEVNFTLRGSRGSLEGLRKELNRRGLVIDYDVSGNYTSQDKAVTVETALQKTLSLSESGLSLKSASPSVIPMHLDSRIRTEPLPVEFKYVNATLLGEPKIEPARLSAFVAESRWKEVEKAIPDPAARKLITRTVDLRNAAAGTITREVEVLPAIAGVPGVVVEPERRTVKVTFTVDQPTDRKTLTVSVRVQSPPAWANDGTWEKFSLVVKTPLEWRKEITVSGSKEDLGKLKAADIDAYVVLREEDKKGGSWWSGEVRVRLPDGLQLELVGEAPKVQYRLEPHTPAAH